VTAGRIPIVLASTSSARIALLGQAGVEFTARAAPIDERLVEAPLLEAKVRPVDIAAALAAAKARSAGADDPSALTVGADQVLESDGRRWTKPASLAEAQGQLRALAGKAHLLHSAVAVARGETILWSHVDTASLTMRRFSESFLDAYLDAVGDKALSSVGAYQIEGPGIQLFEKIDGDYFTILGLPLLPLLAFLRSTGAIPT
jgi:septum formation protein